MNNKRMNGQFWLILIDILIISSQRTKQLQHGKNNRCLEIKSPERKLVVNDCDEDNANQQWEFGFVNQTAIDHWEKKIK